MPAKVVYRANQAATQRLLQGTGGPVQLYVANLGRKVEGEARRRVGVRTGRLKASIRSRLQKNTRGDWVAVISADTPYAMYHHDGTRPHDIEGNPLLVFYWPKAGRTMFLPRVHHPGTRPHPFLLDALRAAGLTYSRRVRL